MRIRAVFTDLDGTLLEADGSLSDAARSAVEALRARGVPLAPVSSKTRAELAKVMRELGASYGAFENGAGILTPAGVVLAPGAVPVTRLRAALGEASRRGARLVALDAMTDGELAAATGLPSERLAAARAREYDLPFLAPALTEREISRAIAAFDPALRIVRGGIFWHLSGRHDKKEAVARILDRLPAGGVTVGLGDAPNDDFLETVDVPVVLPRASGPDPELLRRLPSARVAPRPCGAGWAAVIESLLAET